MQLDVDTELLVERLAGRAQAEGRADDSPEAVRNRLRSTTSRPRRWSTSTASTASSPVVDGVGSLDEVFTRIIEAISRAMTSAENRDGMP